jgi:hypothetical protein
MERTASAASTEKNGTTKKTARCGQGPSDDAREGGDADVAGVVEGGIPPHASRQLLARDEAERKGCDRRAKNVADHRDETVGD